MRSITRISGAALLLLTTWAEASGPGTGGIDGQFSLRGAEGFADATVVLEQTGASAFTDENGRFHFRDLAAGTYDLSFAHGTYKARQENVQVTAGSVTRVETVADWDIFYMEVVMVRAASRRPERVTEAPNAAAKLNATDIEREAVAGQLPRSLRFMPGAEITQSGLYDFNLNTRGFNTAINRRVLTMIDWRDSSVPAVLGYQEWSALSVPLGEIESVEFIRGPGAALYGAGAFNGVLDIRTREPRDDPGGRVTVALGELDTQRIEARHAGELGQGWYYRVQAGYQSSDDFTRSRTGSVEYAPGLLPGEVVAPVNDRDYRYASLRADRYFDSGNHFVAEIGTSTAENFVTVTPVGRSQASEAERPWARLFYGTPNLSFSAYYTGRDADDLVSLSAGNAVYLESHNMGIDFQGNTHFSDGRGHLVYGASAGNQEVDSVNPQGFHTVFARKEDADRWAVFGQVDYDFSESLTGVLSARYDESSLHDGQFSPRAALVWKPHPKHTFRISYADAFQRPSLSEYFLDTPVGLPIDLSALEAALTPLLGGVPLGFANVPLLGLGNRNLELEEVTSFEVGWKAILGERTFLEVSVFDNEISNFTSNLLPNVGTSLGRLNPDYGPYAPPPELDPASAAIVLGTLNAALPPELLALMSNDLLSRAPIFAAATFGNFGEASTRGVELGLIHEFRDHWRFDFSYTWFDFDIEVDAPENALVPNTPEHSASVGIYYADERYDWALRYRWVDEFLWSSGVFRGPVEQYGTADLYANFRINERYRAGLEVANLFDDEHYEIFGGDLLERRMMAYVTATW